MEVKDIKKEDICAVDPAFWAASSNIKLQRGSFTFEGREYLEKPMRSMARRRCFMKGTQGGASLICMLFVLWGMIYKRYPQGVLYLMPTMDDIREFSQSKFAPLISDNYHHLGKFIKLARGADSTTLKKVKDAFLFLRPGTLARKIDFGYSESSKLKAISVDCVVFDELDTMEDQDVVQKALGRYGASEVKDEIYIGNPGTPLRGIDAVHRDSDQQHWWMSCRKCGAKTCAEKEFFDDPTFIKVQDDGSGWMACRKCGNRIYVCDGEWIPDVPSKTEYMEGYRWSQLIIPFSNPAEILHDFRYPPQGNLGDVMRTKLGMPYIATDDVLTESQVWACSDQNRTMLDSHPGPCAMGVDVGDVKHVIIGGRTDRSVDHQDHYEAFKIIQVKSWDAIHDLARRFNVRSAVVDSGPMRDSAREFQRREKYKVFLCQYNESTVSAVQYNSKSGIVKVNRTEIFDRSGRVLAGKRVVLPRKSPAMREFVKQATDPICVEEQDKRSNALVRRYRGREDHYRNALNYFLLAADGGKVGMLQNAHRQPRAAYAINERKVG